MNEDSQPSIRPRLGFVGHMVGRNPGYITTQGQILADLFEQASYSVVSFSPLLNKYRRLADIVVTLTRQRRNIDVLIVEVYGGLSFVAEDIASWLGRRFGHRVVMWLHGGALPEFMARFPHWTRRVLGRADVIVTPSEFLARAVATYGFQAQIVANVVDLSAYPFRLRRKVSPRLFWMRTFHPFWNPLMAVRVLARLRETIPGASLVMAGRDKGFEAEARQLASQLGLNGAVRFAGFLDLAEKVREGQGADIYINTNRIDNMPVAVVEACAMGLPVVATAVGGIPDLLKDGETGLLVPDDDDKMMVEAIKRLLNDSELAGRLSANGRRVAERSSWEQVRLRWEQLFAVLMARRAL
ncbi:MAG: glycosyltransferase family 4 protein [Pyrinomonadaceae bacterium]